MLEIQQEAKRRFPIGCKYKSTSGYVCILTLDRDVYSIHDKAIFATAGRGLLYSDGEWAELLEEPKVIQNEYKCSPFPSKNYTKLKVVKDIPEKEIGFKLPYIIPAGSITWISNVYLNNVLTKSGNVHIENNRYYANIKAEYFELLEPVEEELKEGDWVMCIGNSSKCQHGTSLGWEKGLVYQITSIDNYGDYKILFGGKDDNGVYLTEGHLRKATESEINVYKQQLINNTTHEIIEYEVEEYQSLQKQSIAKKAQIKSLLTI